MRASGRGAAEPGRWLARLVRAAADDVSFLKKVRRGGYWSLEGRRAAWARGFPKGRRGTLRYSDYSAAVVAAARECALRNRRGWLSVAVLAILSVAWAPGAAVAKQSGNHCISPAGEDLNEVFATRDAFVAPFCTEVHTGDRWRAILRIQVAGSDQVFPAGYVPSQTLLDEDFLAKFVSARFVVDAGTAQERSYTFPASELVIQTGALPDGSRFVRWVTPSMHPLPPGDHTLDEGGTLTADFWDGLGLDPAINLIPAGESFAGSVQFQVIKRP